MSDLFGYNPDDPTDLNASAPPPDPTADAFGYTPPDPGYGGGGSYTGPNPGDDYTPPERSDPTDLSQNQPAFADSGGTSAQTDYTVPEQKKTTDPTDLSSGVSFADSGGTAPSDPTDLSAPAADTNTPAFADTGGTGGYQIEDSYNPPDAAPTIEDSYNPPDQKQGGGNWWDKVKSTASDVGAQIKDSIDPAQQGWLPDLTFSPNLNVKSDAASAVDGLGQVAGYAGDVYNRTVAEGGLVANDLIRNGNLSAPENFAASIPYDITGQQSPWQTDTNYRAANVLADSGNGLSAVLPGTAGGGDAGIYDVPVIGGAARVAKGVWDAGTGSGDPAIDTEQLQQDVASGQYTDKQLLDKYPGNEAWKVVQEVLNPVNFVEPEIAGFKAGDIIASVLKSPSERAANALIEQTATDGWTPEATAAAQQIMDTRGSLANRGVADISAPSLAQTFTDARVTAIPGMENISTALDTVPALYDGAAKLAQYDGLGVVGTDGIRQAAYEDAKQVATDLSIQNTGGPHAAETYLDAMETIVQGARYDLASIPVADRNPLTQLATNTAQTAADLAPESANDVSKVLAARADALARGAVSPRDLQQVADMRRIDLAHATPAEMDWVRAEAMRNTLASDVRAAMYERAGVALPTTHGALQKSLAGTFNAVRGLLLMAAAPPLAIQKFSDEWFRAATEGVISVRPSDLTSLQALSRFGADRNLLGQGDRFSAFRDSGTLRNSAIRNDVLPPSSLNPLSKAPYSFRDTFAPTNRYGEAMTPGDRLAASLGAPFRGIAKWNDSLIGAPTQHVLMNAFYHDTKTLDATRAAIAEKAYQDILASGIGPEEAAIARDRLATATTQRDFVRIGTDIQNSTGVHVNTSPIVPARGMAQGAPSARVAADIGRTPTGLVGDAGTPLRPGFAGTKIPLPNEIAPEKYGRNLVSSAGAGVGRPSEIAPAEIASGVKSIGERLYGDGLVEGSSRSESARPALTRNEKSSSVSGEPLAASASASPSMSNPNTSRAARPASLSSGDDLLRSSTATTAVPPQSDTIVPQGAITGPEGGPAKIAFENGETHDARYRVVEAADLKINHPDVQPRDRASGVSDQQVGRIARNFDPARIINESRATGEATPIITPDGKVLSGNGRTTALVRLDDAAYAPYRAMLTRDAARYGINPADLATMNRPVLVRESLTPLNTQQDALRFAEKANAAATLARDTTETTTNDLRHMTPDVLASFRATDTNGLSAAVNQNDEAVTRFIRSIQADDPNAAAALVDGSGVPRQVAYDRFENALVGAAYGDAAAIATRVLEERGAEFATIGNALRDAAPQMARVSRAAPEATLGPDLQWAMSVLPSVKAAGGVENYLANGALFTDAGRTPEGENLLRILWENRNSKSALTNDLRAYARLVTPNETAVSSFFPDLNRVRTKAEALAELAHPSGTGGGGFNDIEATGGAAGYLSRRQLAVRDDLNAMGGFGTGTTRDYKPGSAPGSGGRRAGVTDQLVQEWRDGIKDPQQIADLARQTYAQADAAGDVAWKHRIEDRLLDNGQAAAAAGDRAGYTTLNDVRRELFGETTLNKIDREARRTAELAAPTARPFNAGDAVRQRMDALGIQPTGGIPGPRQIGSDARFTPTEPLPLDPTDLAASRGNAAPLRSDLTDLAAGSGFRPVERNAFTPTESAPSPLRPNERGTIPLGAPRDLRAISGAYQDAGDAVIGRGAELAQAQRAAVKAGTERGYRIVGNQGDQTTLGGWMKNGVGGVTPPILPFAPFHIHSAQFWARTFANHPALAVGVANALQQLDDYGTLHLPGGQTIGDLTKLLTGAHLVDWAMKAYRYDQAVGAQGGNNPLQRIGKDLAYNTVGNNAFIRPFEYVGDPITSFVQSHTNPLLTGKTDFATGKPAIDPREQYKTSGTMAGLTGVGQSLNDRFGQPLPRNVVTTLTNPGQAIGNLTRTAVSNLSGSDLRQYAFENQIPYKAQEIMAATGFDTKRFQAAEADAMTGNPRTADGRAILNAYQHVQDRTALGRIAPIQVGRDEKGIYPPTAFSPTETAAHFRAIDYQQRAGSGGRDLGTGIPAGSFIDTTGKNAGQPNQYFIESPEQARYNTARADIVKANPVTPESVPFMDYNRQYLGNADVAAMGTANQQNSLAGVIAGNAQRTGAGLPQDQRLQQIAKEEQLQRPVGTNPDGTPFTLGDLLKQSGVNDIEAKLHGMPAGPEKTALENQLAAIKAELTRTNPVAAQYLSQQDAAFKANSPSGQFYAGLAQPQKDAYDAFNDLRSSADYQRYDALIKEETAAGPFGSPGEKAWYNANKDELNRLKGVIGAAEQSIIDRYGVNPKELANQAALAAGRPAPYANTAISAPGATTTTSSGSYAKKPFVPYAKKPFVPYTAAQKAAYGRSLHPGTSGGSSSATAQAIAGRADFNTVFQGLTKSEQAAAYKEPALASVLAKGARPTAAEWTAATATLKDMLRYGPPAGTSGTSGTSGAPTGSAARYSAPPTPYRPTFFSLTPADIAAYQQGTYTAHAAGLAGGGLPGSAPSFPTTRTTTTGSAKPFVPYTAAQKAAYGRQMAAQRAAQGLPGSTSKKTAKAA